MRGEGAEGEEKDGGEIGDGYVAYIGVIGSEVGNGCQLGQAGGFCQPS